MLLVANLSLFKETVAKSVEEKFANQQSLKNSDFIFSEGEASKLIKYTAASLMYFQHL